MLSFLCTKCVKLLFFDICVEVPKDKREYYSLVKMKQYNHLRQKVWNES